MDEINEIKVFINNHRSMIPDTTEREKCKYKSVLVFTYLYQKHFGRDLPTDVYNELMDDDIGLIGPGRSCLTNICHWIFERYLCIKFHAILHDAYGRFYHEYKLDKGYTYCIPESLSPSLVKNCALLGQISGIIFCNKNKLSL